MPPCLPRKILEMQPIASFLQEGEYSDLGKLPRAIGLSVVTMLLELQASGVLRGSKPLP